MKRFCNRRFVAMTTINPNLLIQVALRRYLDGTILLKETHPIHNGPTFVFKDASGFKVWPWRSTPLKLSFGHVVHGQEMTTGYPPGLAYPTNQSTDFDNIQYNITLESWAWNCVKYCHKISDTILLERFDNIRTDLAVRVYWELPTFENLELPLPGKFTGLSTPKQEALRVTKASRLLATSPYEYRANVAIISASGDAIDARQCLLKNLKLE